MRLQRSHALKLVLSLMLLKRKEKGSEAFIFSIGADFQTQANIYLNVSLGPPPSPKSRGWCLTVYQRNETVQSMESLSPLGEI